MRLYDWHGRALSAFFVALAEAPCEPAQPMIYTGTSGFQYPEWKGPFYPEKMSAAKMLAYYAERFSTTESNYTFRRIPSVATLEKWVAETPAHFRFSLKAPQRITHFAKLKGPPDTLLYFCETALNLGQKLGTILFQLPGSFHCDVAVLSAFVATLPSHLRFAFEFRHTSWFNEDVYSALRSANVALCIAHSDALQTPIVATADHGYLRLREVAYTDEQIDQWASTLLTQTSWRDAVVYFKHEEAGTGPKFTALLNTALRKVGCALPGGAPEPSPSSSSETPPLL